MFRNNRLAEQLERFASNSEIPYQISDDNEAALLQLHVDNLPYLVNYQFDPSEDYYHFVSPIAEVNEVDYESISRKVLSSSPVPGLTERIEEGKLVIYGKQDDLVDRTDGQIQSRYFDDLARIQYYIKQFNEE